MRAVHDAVDTRIDQRRVSEVGMPGVTRQLAGDHRRMWAAQGTAASKAARGAPWCHSPVRTSHLGLCTSHMARAVGTRFSLVTASIRYSRAGGERSATRQHRHSGAPGETHRVGKRPGPVIGRPLVALATTVCDRRWMG